MRILVVDDDETTAELIAVSLRVAGHRVDTRTFGFTTLLSTWAWDRFDAVLCDLVLGDDEPLGTAILAYVAKLRPEVRRVLLTGSGQRPPGSNGFTLVQKPATIEEILDAIDA